MNKDVMTPISWLLVYMTGKFEQTNEHFFELCEELIRDRKLHQYIQIDSVKEGFIHHHPAMINPKGEMTYNECFLCYLWCMCYYGLVSYEKAVVVHQQNKQNGTDNEIDKKAIAIAEKAREYAMSLVRIYSEWPSEIPTPQEHDTNETVNLANQLFLYAMNYIMCHETAHVVLEHRSGLSGEESYQQEYEADMWAFDAILTPPYKDSELTIQMGILMGLCSMIMILSRTEDGKTHPSSFKRLNNYFEKIKPDPNSQLYAMACLYIGVWDMAFSKGYDWPEQCDNYKEMYDNIYKQIVPNA